MLIKFYAEVEGTTRGEIFWQVVNTGHHAASSNALRGINSIMEKRKIVKRIHLIQNKIMKAQNIQGSTGFNALLSKMVH